MKLLALETSTDACSVALAVDGVSHVLHETGVKHSSRILPMIEQLLADAQLGLGQLDALAFGQGPGSFTGLRIGVGVIQGLGFARDLPVVPISSLAALAQGGAAERLLTAQDARMQEVYWASYVRNAAGLVELQGEEQLLAPGAVAAPAGEAWLGIGSGWQAYGEILMQALGAKVQRWCVAQPQASAVALLAQHAYAQGQALAAELVRPVYLRDKVARTRREREGG